MTNNFFVSEEDAPLFENLTKTFVQATGGIIINFGADDCLEGFERPGADNSYFILKQLLLNGVEDEEIAQVFEGFLHKNKIKVSTTQ